mgnify:CR=1 FL=1
MRQKDEMERTENARARSNRHILWLTYGIAALFIAMAVYFGWFIQFKSENVIGSSYNARLDLLSDRVTRGRIFRQKWKNRSGVAGEFLPAFLPCESD